ncbi:spherulation-specific family 4 protein [Piscinibacter sp. XHJ-5]|uniref:spherulation-specific family 4 protein n=1 Tax=Piscinibacter sp. XHJ-5 TaxID=3037797 RepID=UPI002452E264|nr:spherulation-specific family 4 protein [Piscinibacter sp. XHJ-5]
MSRKPAFAAAAGFERSRAPGRIRIGKGACALILAISASAVQQANASGTIVPAYFRSTSSPNHWSTLAASASRVQTTAILNPSSGPGAAKDESYADAVEKLHLSGGKIIGYVDTGYATRDKNVVLSEIAKYKKWYGVDGVFLDQMTDDVAHVTYYADLYNYIKAIYSGFHVVGNAGKNTVEQYASLPAVDTIVVFEGAYKSFTQYVPRSWMQSYGRERFAYLVYSASSASMKEVANHAVTHNIGYVYATDDSPDNPWNTLPPYWDQEVTKLRETSAPCNPFGFLVKLNNWCSW